MKSLSKIISVVALATCLGGAASAATMEGMHFDDSAKLAGSQLQLNGLGMRAVLIIKGYVAGLYLPHKVSTAEEAMAQAGPKRVQIRMLREAGPEVFNKALISGIRKNATEAELVELKDRMGQFERMIEAVGITREGDTINMDYTPGKGMTLSVNGSMQPTVITGADFYNAVLGIFVGAHPVDAKLKKGLLGQ